MKVSRLRARRYRSLRDFEIEIGALNLLIGANAAGKSNVLDALRFLADGLREKDFSRPLAARGGPLHLAWKGEEADEVDLELNFDQPPHSFLWKVVLDRHGVKREELNQVAPKYLNLLLAEYGKGEWKGKSGARKLQMTTSTGCALAVAAADPEFAARELDEFIGGWAFFDFEPQQLRRASFSAFGDGDQLELTGRNLAQRLYALDHGDSAAKAAFKNIVENTRAILGLPEKIETRKSDEEGRYYFVQTEPGLNFPVNQVAVSAGTLRVLALMAALFAEGKPGLVGIEEPENYVHPRALGELGSLIVIASTSLQILVTTHSPILLNAIQDPEAVRVIVRSPESGTTLKPCASVGDIRAALKDSGFGLGDFYDSQGFGA